jgi:hypothetical protein
MELVPADTRVFLFHSPNASRDTSAAMDDVNQWLNKDRSHSPYANLRVHSVDVTPDGAGGVYTIVVCSLGQVVHTEPQEDAQSQADAGVDLGG